MRCLALAQAWQDQHGTVALLAVSLPSTVKELLESNGLDVRLLSLAAGSDSDAHWTSGLAKDLGASWIVADGYNFDVAFQSRIKEDHHRLLILDDFGHASFYHSDIILNQNLSAEESMYDRRRNSTVLLLGSKYALLRREFLAWMKEPGKAAQLGRRVLITMGGSDPLNLTMHLAHSIHRSLQEDVELILVLGPGNPNKIAVRDWAQHTGSSAKIIENAKNMPGLMVEADLAVSAGGSTCWELAFMGVPNVIIPFAENQEPIAASLAECGAAINLGRAHDVDFEMVGGMLRELMADQIRRAEMSAKGRNVG